ncbi:MAG: tRNA (adenosine(37)-N6)-threonylcarbamoyltransferase complex ATPase subunit type 1 TsaE [Bacteroidaceae bacterium]|nr:tRNA (adenosine(37)-N6)-threonylcarbamoyltransferase complex ATPase subunit type 1 TsaE [Bacteroidaceae bacterium]MBQ3992848.1 tRNA (adenosine(37)-N6)-threonylcarbamoyltransferase complex ATPase subunit type 1 TsaE [Bacteroidaceae bacterium]
MNQESEIIFGLDEIDQAATRFLEALGERRIVAFYGSMGAGKTTFIRALCRQLGVEDTVTSPTFALVNEYRNRQGDSIFHFDFYRIRRLVEAIDMGCDEYFQSGHLCLIEWPELVEELLPTETLRVTIQETPDGLRHLTL